MNLTAINPYFQTGCDAFRATSSHSVHTVNTSGRIKNTTIPPIVLCASATATNGDATAATSTNSRSPNLTRRLNPHQIRKINATSSSTADCDMNLTNIDISTIHETTKYTQ